MLIVSIETSGRHGSVALCRGDQHRFEVFELAPLEGGSYSATLVPRIAGILQSSGLKKTDIDGVVVVSGPGSFTGLRVGLATAKGLCEALQRPLAAISMLEALAVTYGRAGSTALLALDAGRGEVYAGEYEIGAGTARKVQEYIRKLPDFITFALTTQAEIFTPEASLASALQQASANVKLVEPLQADITGRIGLRKLLAGEISDLATVDVNYIRRSDAEIFSSPSAHDHPSGNTR